MNLRLARRLFFGVACILAMPVAPGAGAQSHSDWTFCGVPLNGNGVAVGRIDGALRRTTIAPTGAFTGDVQGATFDVDNRDLIVAHSRNVLVQFIGGVYRISRSGSVVQTLFDERSHVGVCNDVVLTPNGSFAVACGPFGSTPGHIVVVGRGGGVTTIYRGTTTSGPLALAVDQTTGGFTVLDGPLPRTTLLSVTRAGNASTIAILPRGGSQIAEDPTTGDWYVGASTAVARGVVLLRVTRQGSVSTVIASGFIDAAALCLDRASAPRPRLLFATGPLGSGVHAFDLVARAVTTILPVPIYRHTHLMPDQANNVAAVARGQRHLDILINFPSEAGRAYALAISISGIRPGFRLADGRRVALNLDTFTALGLQGRLAPLLTGASGILNALGRGVARLDLRTLPGLAGTRVWCLAVTLDPQSPTGIGTVSDPRIIVL